MGRDENNRDDRDDETEDSEELEDDANARGGVMETEDLIKPENQRGEPKEYLSSDGRFRVRVAHYASGKGTWDVTRGEVQRRSAGGTGDWETLAAVNRNYSSFPLFWFTDAQGVPWLITGESYMNQTFVRLDLPADTPRAEIVKTWANDDWCWVVETAKLSPDGRTLLVPGCYWACPYHWRAFDVSDPTRGTWPEIPVLDTPHRTGKDLDHAFLSDSDSEDFGYVERPEINPDGSIVWRRRAWIRDAAPGEAPVRSWNEEHERQCQRMDAITELEDRCIAEGLDQTEIDKRTLAFIQENLRAHHAAIQDDAGEELTYAQRGYREVVEHEILYTRHGDQFLKASETKDPWYDAHLVEQERLRLLWQDRSHKLRVSSTTIGALRAKGEAEPELTMWTGRRGVDAEVRIKQFPKLSFRWKLGRFDKVAGDYVNLEDGTVEIQAAGRSTVLWKGPAGEARAAAEALQTAASTPEAS